MPKGRKRKKGDKSGAQAALLGFGVLLVTVVLSDRWMPKNGS